MSVDARRFAHMCEFIATHGDGFGRVVVVESPTDQYSVGFRNGRFVLVNFSPREYAEYGCEEISPDQAWQRLRAVGMTELPASAELSMAVARLRSAERELQEATHDEPWDALDRSDDTAMAWVVRDVPPGRQVDGFTWRAEARIFGEATDAGLSVWITEDTGHEGDRHGGPNNWLMHLRFTERTSTRLLAASKAAQQALTALRHCLVDEVDNLNATVAGTSGDLTWLRQMPPEGIGDGRSWEVSLGVGQMSVVVTFTEDLRPVELRVGPAPVTGMAWVTVAGTPDA